MVIHVAMKILKTEEKPGGLCPYAHIADEIPFAIWHLARYNANRNLSLFFLESQPWNLTLCLGSIRQSFESHNRPTHLYIVFWQKIGQVTAYPYNWRKCDCARSVLLAECFPYGTTFLLIKQDFAKKVHRWRLIWNRICLVQWTGIDVLSLATEINTVHRSEWLGASR